MRPGQSVPFTCTTGGFFPKEILVKWFKNKDSLTAQQPQVTEQREKTYTMFSTVMVTLQKDDVPSQITCQVQHSTLPAPLSGSFQLSRVLRGEGWGTHTGVSCSSGAGVPGRRTGVPGAGTGCPVAAEPGTPNTKLCLSSQFPPLLKCALSRAPLR